MKTVAEMTAERPSRAPEKEPAPAPRTPRQRVVGFLRELAIVVVGALVVSTLLRVFVGQMFVIPSESMENTLLINDRVIVQKIVDFKRGDVVVFADPGGWLPYGQGNPGPLDKVFEFVGIPTANGTGHLIKRVIGLPGDRVVCCDTKGRLTVNGQPLDEESYLYRDLDGELVAPSLMHFQVVVPRDHIFVMGDHRDLSADSRCHLSDVSVQGKGQGAFVPIDMVVGPAFAIGWPFARISSLHRPAAFAQVPAPTAPAPEKGEIGPEKVTC